ncbi:regulator of G protein signaling superfamily [Aureobasidium subglaciale]|nr:regulator of G protein signaling superfamily [Aureobasidium subglaciale]KAI5218349.1 regulator of G protein signaling superfamily [Aureobasidium subglaciale]KAI5221944.1 regulator of G protein signaling superfamily [Aureobasidium subglaciale]KAI5259196.1 regulator of G protein signaling superfamily [Aureobasidium subglaciale]
MGCTLFASAVARCDGPENTTSSNSFRKRDNTLLLVHVSPLTRSSTRQARHSWEIESSTSIPKLAPIFEPQRASVGTLTTDSSHSNPAAGQRRKSSNGFWGSVMSSRKPSHFQTDSAHSAKIAIYSSTADCDADDEATMSSEEASHQQRPASVHMAASAPASVPTSATSSTRPMSSESAPFCPRRPNLREILANTAPAPWTLAAFMAYLSNNHCLETLEFTMDAGRYKKHFHRMMNKAPVPGQPTEHDANYVKELWVRLMEAYIQPNGSREVNLPSQVRDPILGHKPANTLPPEPSVLEPAVSKTYELMEESVLVPFLNSVYPQSPTPVSPYYSNNSNESMSTPVEEKSSRFGRRSRHSSRGSPPPLSASSVEFSASSYSPPSLNNRKSAPSALTTALSRHRFSTKLSPTSSAPSHSLSAALSSTSSASDAIYSGPGLTDDSGSSGSPINDCPMTPPVTPPMSDISGSPRTHRDSGAWKKLGRLSGWKPSRKRSQPGFDLHTT